MKVVEHFSQMKQAKINRISFQVVRQNCHDTHNKVIDLTGKVVSFVATGNNLLSRDQ